MLEHAIRFQNILNVAILPCQFGGDLFEYVANSRRLVVCFKFSDDLQILGSDSRISRVPAIVFVAFDRTQPIERGLFPTWTNWDNGLYPGGIEKSVIPIRPGREQAALNWRSEAHTSELQS